MKQVLIITSFLLAIASPAQSDSLNVGDTWPYNHAYIRTTPDKVRLHAFDYNEGLAAVTYNEKTGFIDSNRAIVIPLAYEREFGANKFINSRSIAIKNGYWGIIDNTGDEVVPFKYAEIRQGDSLYCVHGLDGYTWGYLDLFGNTVLPLDNHYRSSIMTKKEVFELAKEYYRKDSLENLATISREKAIAMAKEAGYYVEGNFPFAPSVELDMDSTQWVIKSTERKGVTKKGDCAHTNGCIVHVKYLIKIDSNTGVIHQKSKEKILIPVYE